MPQICYVTPAQTTPHLFYQGLSVDSRRHHCHPARGKSRPPTRKLSKPSSRSTVPGHPGVLQSALPPPKHLRMDTLWPPTPTLPLILPTSHCILLGCRAAFISTGTSVVMLHRFCPARTLTVSWRSVFVSKQTLGHAPR